MCNNEQLYNKRKVFVYREIQPKNVQSWFIIEWSKPQFIVQRRQSQTTITSNVVAFLAVLFRDFRKLPSHESSFKIQLRWKPKKLLTVVAEPSNRSLLILCTAKKKNDWKIQIFSMLLLDSVKASDDRKEFYANVLRLFWWKTKSEGDARAKWSMFRHVDGIFTDVAWKSNISRQRKLHSHLQKLFELWARVRMQCGEAKENVIENM